MQKQVKTKSLLKYRHIIWDWNGTLLDDSALSMVIFNEMLVEVKLDPIDSEFYGEHFGFPIQEFYRRAGFEFDEKTFHHLGGEWQKRYEERRGVCGIHSGALQIIQSCLDRGISHSVLSSHMQVPLEAAIREHGLYDKFKIICGIKSDRPGSKIDNAKQLILDLGHSPSEVVLIGDMSHDYEAAMAIGCDCILMSHGHNSHQRLSRFGAPVYRSFADVIEELR